MLPDDALREEELILSIMPRTEPLPRGESFAAEAPDMFAERESDEDVEAVAAVVEEVDAEADESEEAVEGSTTEMEEEGDFVFVEGDFVFVDADP